MARTTTGARRGARSTRRPLRMIALGLLLASLLAACASAGATPPADDDGVTVRFSTPAGEFIVRLEGEENLARLEGAQPGDHVGIPNGRLVRGDGGINVGHDWHLVDVEMADSTMEVCDGTADYVDELGYDRFLEEHGDRFCPWAAMFEEIIG